MQAFRDGGGFNEIAGTQATSDVLIDTSHTHCVLHGRERKLTRLASYIRHRSLTVDMYTIKNLDVPLNQCMSLRYCTDLCTQFMVHALCLHNV